MGLTIHYRGKLDDVNQVDLFEQRVHSSPLFQRGVGGFLLALFAELTWQSFEVSDLQINDEGEYWETGNVGRLLKLHGLLGAKINSLANRHEKHPLTNEAAEDPDILIRRIERIATAMHREGRSFFPKQENKE